MSDDLQKMLVALEERKSREGRRPLDVLYFPKERLSELYERYDRANKELELDDEALVTLDHLAYFRLLKFWQWVTDVVPAARGKEMSLNAKNTVQPVIEVYANQLEPPDDPQYSSCFRIPDEQVETVGKLLALDQYDLPGPQTSRYRLWSKIVELFPEAMHGNWRLVPTHTGVYVVKAARDALEERLLS